MADIGNSIGMNLKLGICIWYQSEFRVSVSGIGISMNSGYRYHYGSSAGYLYQGISGTLGQVESGQVQFGQVESGQDESGQVESGQDNAGNMVGLKFFGTQHFFDYGFSPPKVFGLNFFGPTSATFSIWQSC